MTQATGDRASVDTALQPSREMMSKDGYLLTWSKTEEDSVVVHIDAGPEACADCLVPLPVMEAIMSEALTATPYRLDHVVLPTGAH